MMKSLRIPLALFSGLMVVFVLLNGGIITDLKTQFVDGDGSGHYAYLPAIFVHHTVDFTPVLEAEKSRKSADYVGHNYHQQGEVLINKFPSGTAILIAPFYVIAYIVSEIAGMPADGYNIVFQWAVGIAGVFWLSMGLWFLIRLLQLNKIRQKRAIWFTITGLLSTNLFFYGFINPSFSHVYSFFAITAFFYFITRLFKPMRNQSPDADLYWSAFFFGLVLLIRPANALAVLAVPFLAGGFLPFWKKLMLIFSLKRLALALALFLLALSPQLIVSFLQTGSLLVDGYQNEGFFFGHPHLLDFLFSYQKGWFVYTPFMLLLIPGLILMYLRSRARFYPLIFFLFVLVYIFSSWWNWFYGDSFGMRPLVDYYGLFMVIIAGAILKIKRVRLKRPVYAFVGVTIFLNLFQTYQYATGILHPDSMTRDAYWYIFLKSDPAYRGVIAGGDEYFYGELAKTPFDTTLNSIDRLPVNWSLNEKSVVYAPEINSLAIEQNEEFIYSPSFLFDIPDGFTEDSTVYVRFKLHYKELVQNAALHALIVMDITDQQQNHIFYKAFRFKRLPDKRANEWRETSLGFKIPPIQPDYHRIKFYVWNKNKEHYLLDDLGIEFFRYGVNN